MKLGGRQGIQPSGGRGRHRRPLARRGTRTVSLPAGDFLEGVVTGPPGNLFDTFALTGLFPTAPVAPAAPTDLSATPSTDASGNPQVNLVWDDNADNETGYTVERSADGVNFTRVGTTPADQTDFVDSTGLTVGTTYTYRVKATGARGTRLTPTSPKSRRPSRPPWRWWTARTRPTGR